jgi:hypothetical protein
MAFRPEEHTFTLVQHFATGRKGKITKVSLDGKSQLSCGMSALPPLADVTEHWFDVR